MISTLTGNKNLDIDILNRLDDKDLVAFCQTSKYAYELCNDQKLWLRRLISRIKGILPLDMMKKYKGDRKWSDYYIELREKLMLNKEGLLFNSSEIGRLDLVILAISARADIHWEDNLALAIASKNGHLDVVKYLIDKGADVHAGNNLSLRWASNLGHLEVVKYLVEKGADIHANGDLAIKFASRSEYLDVVKYLVRKGANVLAGYYYAYPYLKEKNTETIKYLEKEMKKHLINK